MNKEILNKIKDKIYEAEGLLELLHLREDKLDDLVPMIQSRINEANHLINELKPQDNVFQPDESAESVLVVDGSEQPAEYTEEEEPTFSDVDTPDELNVGTLKEEPEKSEEENITRQNSNPAFCLNDRFRFRRILFDGNDSEFNAVMDHVATLPSFDDAEDYFYGELGYDPEDEDVIDFMTIIRNYFQK